MSKGARSRIAAWLAWSLIPFAVLACEPRRELALGAAGWVLLSIPGLLAMARWLPVAHPLRRFPAPLAMGPALGLLLFGLVTTLATKLHWSFSAFLWTYAAVYTTTCLALRFWPSHDRTEVGIEPGPAIEPGPPGERWFGWVMLGGLALTMVALCFGRHTPGGSHWIWTGVGLASGTVVLFVAVACRGRAGKAIADSSSVDQPEVEASERLDLGLACVLWVGVVLFGLHLMLVAYERRDTAHDDVTHVSRAVDFLTGEPMDRYEPSLGESLPMDPGYVIATQSLLLATFSRLTGISCAALQHGVLPPLVVLAGLGAWATLVGLLLLRHRILWPLATLLLLAALSFSYDGYRSLAHHSVYLPTVPKAVHLVIVMPLQIASMVLVMTRPGRRNTWLAVLLAVAGYVIHPWSVIAGAVWAGSFLLFAIIAQRSALVSVVVVLAAFVGLGLFHMGLSRLLGGGGAQAVTPEWTIELQRLGNNTFASTLNPSKTIGHYTFFRMGVLALPWIALLGLRMRGFRPFVIVGALTLGFAYFEPLGRLMALAVPQSLLWRARWMYPSVIGVVTLAVCFAWAVLKILPSSGSLTKARHPVAVLATCAAFGWMLGNTGSSELQRGGPVARLSKFPENSHKIVEAMGGIDAAPFLLTPPQSKIARHIPQLVPRARLIVSRRLIIEWFLGVDEADRRHALLASFYNGRMGQSEFQALLDEFPVDWVAVDYRRDDVDGQKDLLSVAGWSPRTRIGRYELWRPD